MLTTLFFLGLLALIAGLLWLLRSLHRCLGALPHNDEDWVHY